MEPWRQFWEIWNEECSICLQHSEAAHYFVNECKCKHLICLACANKMSACPFCRAPFLSRTPPTTYIYFQDFAGKQCSRCLKDRRLFFRNECHCTGLLCKECIEGRTTCPLCLSPFYSVWYKRQPPYLSKREFVAHNILDRFRPYLDSGEDMLMSDDEWQTYWEMEMDHI